MPKEQILVKILRLNHPGESSPRYDEFILPYQKGATILGILRYIYRRLDPTLAFRNYYCGAMVCGCCRVTANGKSERSCRAAVGPGETLILEPHDRGKVIRDLAVEFED